jgi:ribose transport system permease protein
VKMMNHKSLLENTSTIKKNMGAYEILRRLIKMRETSIFFIIIFMCVVMTFLSPVFLTKGNLLTTMIGLSLDAIVAIGMTVALVSGGFDLSVGSVLAFSSVVTGYLVLHGVNIWLAILISILLSAGIGSLTGFFIAKVGVNPLIMTLGMMGVIRGIAYVITQGTPLSISGLSSVSFKNLGQGTIATIPTILVILLILTILGDLFLRKSAVMRTIYYVGSNEKAALLSGIAVNKVRIWVYVITAILASIAGILALSRFGVATPTAGNQAELRAIAACVIGGASLKGGEGTIYGTILGVILVGLVNNALILLNVSVYWQALVLGFVLIAAVTFDVISNRKKAA